MKRKDSKEKQAVESSKRGSIKAATQARDQASRERNLIESTIGEAVRVMMGDGKTAPDMAAIYKRKGGTNPSTIELLNKTFGRRGIVSLKPGAPPDFNKLTSALASKAEEIARKTLTTGLKGTTRRPARLQVVKIGRNQPTPAVAVFRISRPGAADDTDIEDVVLNCGSGEVDVA